jgi:hypothetical protein
MASKSLAAAFALTTALLAGPASANGLSGDEIRALIQDRTVHLSTPYGVTLPLRYGANGQVTGDISGITPCRAAAGATILAAPIKSGGNGFIRARIPTTAPSAWRPGMAAPSTAASRPMAKCTT